MPFRDFMLPAVGQPDNTVWRFTYYKPERRPGVVCATQGVYERQENVSFFKMDMMGAARHRRTLPGRATKRAIAQTLAALLREMAAAELVPADRAAHYITQAEAV